MYFSGESFAGGNGDDEGDNRDNDALRNELAEIFERRHGQRRESLFQDIVAHVFDMPAIVEIESPHQQNVNDDEEELEGDYQVIFK